MFVHASILYDELSSFWSLAFHMRSCGGLSHQTRMFRHREPILCDPKVDVAVETNAFACM